METLVSIPEGTPGNTPFAPSATAPQYRYEFHSDENLQYRQSTLVSLVNIWNNGYRAASGTIPIMSAVACRWHALNLLRTFVYRRENPGLAFIGAQLPAALGGLPQVYWKFWRNPRLSTVGAEIGSDTVRNKSKHIDIDWFGPAGDGVDCNWWVGEVDGHAEETATARALIDL